MRLGIDLRPLLGSIRTGVGEYTAGLVLALAKTAGKHELVLWINARNRQRLEDLLPDLVGHPQVRFVATEQPNRWLNTKLWLGKKPYLDDLVGGVDVWLSPNSNFTRLRSAKHALVIHDVSFELYPEFFSPKMRWWHRVVNPRLQAQQAAVVLTPSAYTAADVIGRWGIESKKVVVASPALSANFRTTKYSKTEFKIPNNYFLCLGTLEPRKNLAAVIAAFTTWRLQYDASAQLIIAGAIGWDRQLMTVATNQPGVQIRMSVSAAEKSALLQHANCLVYPSWYEGFGLPLLEAMASGTPVIASARAALPEVAHTAAHFVHPDKPAEIVAAWQLLRDEKYRADLVARGYARVAEFDWDQTALKVWSALA